MRRRHAALALATFLLATTLATAPASAATSSIPLHLTGTSTQTVGLDVSAMVMLDPVSQAALNIACALSPGCPNGIWYVGVDTDSMDIEIELTQDVDLDATHTDGLLSEGKTLDVVDTLDPTAGNAEVIVHINGDAGAYVDPEADGSADAFAVDPFTKTLSLGDVSCAVPAPGEPDATCDLPPIDMTILPLEMFPGLGVALALRLDPSITVDSSGLATVREYEVVGTSDSDPLSFVGGPLADPFEVPCGPAGEDLFMNLSDSALSVDPALPSNLQLVLHFTILGQPVATTVLKDRPLSTVDFPTVDLTDAGVDGVSLGTIAPDAQAPVVTGVASSYSGAEGSEIPFAATVEDACGAEDVVWKFSDGSTEYGSDVHKAFADDGSYTGTVTATDARGNKTVKSFTVGVTNQAPAANAGLATVTDWGRPVAFDGQATDPGSVDLGSLAYTWDFGDGTPSATGTKSAVHSYGAPGAYTATLTVTDKDGGSDDAARAVTVTKREATLVYTGATSALPKKSATLSATLSDEYGQPVVGRKVTFTVGTQVISGWTSSNGVATVSLKVNQKIGTYDVSADFDEDSHYLGSTTPTQSFTVGK